jgi:zinc protease
MPSSLVFRLCGLLLLCCSLTCVAAPEPPRGITHVTQVEGITEYRLKNGLQVLLFPDPSKDTVTVNVTYKVGSKHENYGETGMAHLLEHLLFKGTKKHPDVPGEMSAHGAEANGTTSYDRTNYYETFSATPENIDWALRLESDRMVNSFIAKEDLDSEMTVVRNEFERAENNPFGVLMRGMMAVAYRWHSYGKPTIGARSDIENVAIERLQDFYKLYYQPDNAVLTVAGKFDETQLLKQIQKTFGRIAKPKRELPKLYTVEPPQDGERSVTVRRVADIQWFSTAYHIPSGSHPDYAALQVLAEILGDTPRGRLHQALVEKRLAVTSFGYPFQLQDPGLLFFAAQVDKSGALDSAAKALLEVVEGVGKTPVTEEEVERAKRNLAKQITLAFSSSESIAIALSEYISMGDWRLLFLTRDRFETVTLADVQRVAEQYLVRNNRTEGRFVPAATAERVEIPVVADVSALLQDYEGRAALADGEAFDPSFANIQSRTQTLVLASGAKVALLSKKTRGEQVAVELTMQFGTEKSLHGRGTIAELTSAMLTRGTATYTRQGLQDRLDELQAELNVSGNSHSTSASVITTRQNLPAVIDLLVEILRQPAFNAKELAQLQDRIVTSMEAGRQEPQSIVGRELARVYNRWPPGHPYHTPTLDEEIQAVRAVTLAEVQLFHREFYGASALQVALVGALETDATLAALTQGFGDWRSASPYEYIPKIFQTLPRQDLTRETPDKENASIAATLPLPVGSHHADAAALELGTYVFGGGFLNSRLVTRLRQQDGLSYNAGAWLGLDPQSSAGSFTAFAIFAPQNLAAVEKGINEELRRLLEQGLSPEELKAAKSGMLQEAQVARTQNDHLAAMLVANLETGRQMDWHQEREARIQALTPAEVQAILRKYLSADQLSVVRAGDFNGTKKQGK